MDRRAFALGMLGFGVGLLVFRIFRKAVPAPPEVPPPTAPAVAVLIDSEPEGVPVSCLYPEVSGSTPLEVSAGEGAVITFQVPKEFNGLRFASVEGGWVVSTDSAVTLKAVAERGKVVMLKYVKPTPETPRWSYDLGAYGAVYVYDIYYDRGKSALVMDVELKPGTTGAETEIAGARVMLLDSEHHGYLGPSIPEGRSTITYATEERRFAYAVEIDVRTRYGGLFPAITIKNEEIRRV